MISTLSRTSLCSPSAKIGRAHVRTPVTLGDLVLDGYGIRIPKHAHGTQNLAHRTSSTKLIIDAMMELFDRIINRNLLVRRINVVACKVVDESLADDEPEFTQLD
mgnify:CR=1 FL=1